MNLRDREGGRKASHELVAAMTAELALATIERRGGPSLPS